MTAYLNGSFLPIEEARVPVLDRGFLFGDGVYEVIPVYAGRLFRLDEHLQRLERSLAEVRIANPHDRAGWTALLERLVAANGGGDLAVYLQITRGVAKRDHAFPAAVHPTVFCMANPITPMSAEQLARGVSAVTRRDLRWGRCDIKAITLLANVLMRQEAAEEGAIEAILVRDGLATEGAASNLFVVRDGVIVTPPKGPRILPGITRDLVVELASGAGLPLREAEIPETVLRTAEEVWLTSSTKEVVPVTRLDGTAVGAGVPGPVWERVQDLYRQYKGGLANAASA
jgi:D-alanine transaminase